jgi:LmbE family N-acetylglucosaminyl deacetylase
MMLFDHDAGQRWLFCFTHPDDEIAICAWIRRLTQAGADVYLSWTHHTEVREREAREVAECLGVPQSNLTFHGAADGGVVDQLWDLLPRFRSMMDEIRPDRVVVGAFEQGHLDHDATNFLVNHSFAGQVLEFPLYHTYLTRLQTLNRFADATGEEVLELTPMEQQLKLQIAKSYPSQNIWKVLFWYEAFRAVTFRPARLRMTERMRLQTHHSFLRPNVPEPLRSKVRASAQWQRWLAAAGPLALELAQDPETLREHGRAFLK